MQNKRLWVRAAATLLALGLVAAACGDDGADDAGSTGSTSGSAASAGGSTTTLSPQKGGSVSIGVYSETRSLDPATSSGSGTAGGTELIALYDTLTRWNPDTRKYDMRTADTVTANATFSEWTVKLKPNIKFRDGSAYDADALKYNMDRFLSTVNTGTSRAWLTYIIGDAKNVTVVDPLTVKFTLKQAYYGFPALLAHTPGMLVSPTKLKALGDPTAADYKAKYDVFSLKPEGAGAGAFEIVSFTKGESIVMKKATSFYGGEAHLDEIKFINLNSSDKTADALKTGTLNIGFLRAPSAIAAAEAEKTLGGINSYIQGGGALLMNQGVKLTCKDGKPDPLCTGKPDGQISTTPNTANAKLRAAVAAALDPAVINTRVNDGRGIPHNSLFDKHFSEDPAVAGVKTDSAAAKKLLEEAKAAGASGKIRLLCTNQPERVALAQTVETQLKAVGFEATARADIDVQTQIGEITTKKDYDLGCWGFSIPNDETAILSLVQNFWSASPTNRVGYANPAWDAAMNEVLAGKDETVRKAAYKKLAELWNVDVPAIIYETQVERVAFQNKVHGVYLTENTMFYLDKTWIEK